MLTRTLRQNGTALAEKVVEIQYQLQPEVWKPFGHPGREKSVRDAGYHLSFLAEAVEAGDPQLFSEYLAWVKVLFAGLNFPDHVLTTTLACTRQVLSEDLPAAEREAALGILDASLVRLQQAPATLPSFIQGEQPIDLLAQQYLDTLLRADRRTASDLVLHAVREGYSVREIYTGVFQRSQREIGRLWQTNQISVAQEHFCTAATQMIMSQLYPYIFSGERKDRGVVVACVGGELHEIGARMVADFFEMDGWNSYFLGANTPPNSVIQTVAERRAEVLAISATMTFNVNKVVEIIRLLRDNPAVEARVMVGGYPFNLSPGLWQSVGADGYAPDAESALLEAERLVA